MSRNGSRARQEGARTQDEAGTALELALALPGGGAYGAFSWGVLDRLLEEADLTFPVVSGASAGAVNGVALAHGWAVGGRKGARETLAAVWGLTADLAVFSPLQPSPLDRMAGPGSLDWSPGYRWLDSVSRLLSPYQFNLFDLNPLREVLRRTIDFKAVRASPVRVHIAATNVRLGRIKVFPPEAASLEAVLASTCLPFLNKAVEIDGEPYWDGAYLANPPLKPLADAVEAPEDLLLIDLDERHKPGPPTGAQEIFDRLNALSGGAGLLAELEWLAAAKPQVRLHGIAEPELLGNLAASSRLNADRQFLHWLRDVGRESAEAWLSGPRARVGERATYAAPTRYL